MTHLMPSGNLCGKKDDHPGQHRSIQAIENRRKRGRVANMTPEQVERRHAVDKRTRRRIVMTPELIERKRARERVANLTPEQAERKRKRVRAANSSYRMTAGGIISQVNSNAKKRGNQ